MKVILRIYIPKTHTQTVPNQVAFRHLWIIESNYLSILYGTILCTVPCIFFNLCNYIHVVIHYIIIFQRMDYSRGYNRAASSGWFMLFGQSIVIPSATWSNLSYYRWLPSSREGPRFESRSSHPILSLRETKVQWQPHARAKEREGWTSYYSARSLTQQTLDGTVRDLVGCTQGYPWLRISNCNQLRAKTGYDIANRWCVPCTPSSALFLEMPWTGNT